MPDVLLWKYPMLARVTVVNRMRKGKYDFRTDWLY